MSTITVNIRKNLGDYQHRDVSVTSIVDGDEPSTADISRIIAKVEWATHKPERLIEYAKQQKLLESEDKAVMAKAKTYIDHFDKMQKEVE